MNELISEARKARPGSGCIVLSQLRVRHHGDWSRRESRKPARSDLREGRRAIENDELHALKLGMRLCGKARPLPATSLSTSRVASDHLR